MRNIYDQHAAAFDRVSAFVIMRGKNPVARIAIKFPRDGAARLTAFVHLLGMEMVAGHSSGYGYDKRTAAVKAAVKKIDPDYFAGKGDGTTDYYVKERKECARFVKAINSAKDGQDWSRSFEQAGYTVLQAV